MQAAEPVPAMDGPPRCTGSRVLAARLAGKTHRAARHARDPRRPLLALDDLHESRLADGSPDHRVAARTGSRGSREIRLRVVPHRDDERVRVQPRTGGLAVSITWPVRATRAYTFAVSAIIRSTVKRS